MNVSLEKDTALILGSTSNHWFMPFVYGHLIIELNTTSFVTSCDKRQQKHNNAVTAIIQRTTPVL